MLQEEECTFRGADIPMCRHARAGCRPQFDEVATRSAGAHVRMWVERTFAAGARRYRHAHPPSAEDYSG